MIPRVGETFRSFRIVEKVGEGGMGEVYRAEDTRLGRPVALKFLTGLDRGDVTLAERLRSEARSLAALNHPHIVTIYDVDDLEGMPVLVLEWVPGRPLDDPTHADPRDERGFLAVALPVAEALAAAHARGIVHRDLKPANVLVTGDGGIKLVDFGLAKLGDGGARLTRTSSVVGTAAYMSPEQITGHDVGPAADVFAFGSLAYRLLTGDAPFQRDSLTATLYSVAHEPHAALATRRTDLSDRLAIVIERCLEKDPASRYADGAALAAALRQVADGSGTGPPADRETMPRPGSTPEIRYCTAADGARIAYSLIGHGPVLIRVLGWFTHLEMEWEWPAMRQIWERLADHFTVVRYDGRGIGLSEPWPGEFTEDNRHLDVTAVLDAIGADRVALFGISEGGWSAGMYTVLHPERVGHLVIYGSYARGAPHRPGYDPEATHAESVMIRKTWGGDSPGFRQYYTTQYFGADADPALMRHFNQLQRASADGETAARYMDSLNRRPDATAAFTGIRKPTLIIHCRDDVVMPFEEGRHLAATIPGAQFLSLPTGTHYFPTGDEITRRIADGIVRFAR